MIANVSLSVLPHTEFLWTFCQSFFTELIWGVGDCDRFTHGDHGQLLYSVSQSQQWPVILNLFLVNIEIFLRFVQMVIICVCLCPYRWVAYEFSQFKGRQMLLQSGEIPCWSDYSGWDTIGSLHPLRQVTSNSAVLMRWNLIGCENEKSHLCGKQK